MRTVSGQDWHARISQPLHLVTEERGRRVRMRDGTELAVDIFRPHAAGRFPALLAYSPYGKDVQRVLKKQRPHSSRLGNGGQEAGDTGYFVSRGYVHIIADVRGSGDSGGPQAALLESHCAGTRLPAPRWLRVFTSPGESRGRDRAVG